MIKTKFFQACIGISMVLLSLGFLLFSVQKASAAPDKIKMSLPGENSGTYVIEMVVVDKKIYANFLNTTNSQQTTFEYDTAFGDEAKWTLIKNQIPNIPY